MLDAAILSWQIYIYIYTSNVRRCRRFSVGDCSEWLDKLSGFVRATTCKPELRWFERKELLLQVYNWLITHRLQIFKTPKKKARVMLACLVLYPAHLLQLWEPLQSCSTKSSVGVTQMICIIGRRCLQAPPMKDQREVRSSWVRRHFFGMESLREVMEKNSIRWCSQAVMTGASGNYASHREVGTSPAVRAPCSTRGSMKWRQFRSWPRHNMITMVWPKTTFTFSFEIFGKFAEFTAPLNVDNSNCQKSDASRHVTGRSSQQA